MMLPFLIGLSSYLNTTALNDHYVATRMRCGQREFRSAKVQGVSKNIALNLFEGRLRVKASHCVLTPQ